MKRLLLCAVITALGAGALLGCGGGSAEPASSTPKPGEASHSAPQAKTGSPSGAAGKQEPAPAAPGKPPSDAYAGTRRLPFGAAPLSPAQRSHLAGTGRVTIPVHVDGAGTVSGFGQAELEGTIRKVAHATPVQASVPGVVDLTLRLTPRARRHLTAGGGGSILMYVGLFFSKSRTAQRLSVHLEG